MQKTIGLLLFLAISSQASDLCDKSFFSNFTDWLNQKTSALHEKTVGQILPREIKVRKTVDSFESFNYLAHYESYQAYSTQRLRKVILSTKSIYELIAAMDVLIEKSASQKKVSFIQHFKASARYEKKKIAKELLKFIREDLTPRKLQNLVLTLMKWQMGKEHYSYQTVLGFIKSYPQSLFGQVPNHASDEILYQIQLEKALVFGLQSTAQKNRAYSNFPLIQFREFIQIPHVRKNIEYLSFLISVSQGGLSPVIAAPSEKALSKYHLSSSDVEKYLNGSPADYQDFLFQADIEIERRSPKRQALIWAFYLSWVGYYINENLQEGVEENSEEIEKIENSFNKIDSLYQNSVRPDEILDIALDSMGRKFLNDYLIKNYDSLNVPQDVLKKDSTYQILLKSFLER